MMKTINNDLKKVFRGKYNINNISTSKIKAGFETTELFYKHPNELYIKEREKELEQLKQKEIMEN